MMHLRLEYADLYRRYPGWDHGNIDAYRSMGRNKDMDSIHKIEESLVLSIPYDYIAMGAVDIDDLDILLYCLNKDPMMDTSRLKRLAERYQKTQVLAYFFPKKYES